MSIDDVVGIGAIAVAFVVCVALWRKLRAVEKENEALEAELDRLMEK